MKTKTLILFLLFSLCGNLSAQSAITVKRYGSGKALLFLPSLGCPGEVWSNVIKPLSKEFNCFVVSIAGFGNRDVDKAFSTERILSELASYCKKVAMKEPILIGHSFGGMLAMRFAIEYPDFFKKMILVDAHAFPMSFANPNVTLAQAQQQATTFKQVILNQPEEAFRQQQTMMLSAGITEVKNRNVVLNWFVQSDRASFATAFAEVLGSDLRSGLSGIRANTLILGTWVAAAPLGVTQEIAETRFETEFQGLQQKHIVLADSSKHFIMYEDPAWLMKQIKSFAQ